VRAFDAAHPLWWDVALALLVALACTSASAGLRPAGAPFLLVACGAVVFRRRIPLLALIIATVALSTGMVVSELVGEAPPWGYLAIWILLFDVGLRRSRGLATAAALAAVVALAAFAGAARPGTLALDERAAALLPVLAMSATALLAGSQLRGARQTQQRHRNEAARAAVAAERSRISREMHDLIGHDLSVIASLSAGGQNVARSSPEDAERAFAAIGEVSRAAVGQLRNVLRLLRSPDDKSVLPLLPQPDLSQLSALIDAVRGAGLLIDDERHGDLRGLPPAHQLAVYRIVQEALTNTLRHGGEGTAATVNIVVSARDVVVSVADRGAVPEAGRPVASTDGHGIIGMRERLDALGGTLEVGPTAAGWLVRAAIPREGGVADEGPPRR
jgi:signal transduction histidine kinase